jgi:hypothetical protein
MAALEIKKKVTNAVLYTNGCIRIDNVRVSFPHLDVPYAGKNGDDTDDNGKKKTPKFGIVGMLPKSSHVAAKDLIKQAMDELLAANDNAKVAADKKFIRNGDDSDREEYADHWTVSAREERQPAIRNQRGELITDPKKIADMIYGGCYCNILIRPWYQDGKKTGAGYGKRVNAGLVGVQFVRDGDSFGEGRIDDTDAWDDVSSSSGGDGFDDDDDL